MPKRMTGRRIEYDKKTHRNSATYRLSACPRDRFIRYYGGYDWAAPNLSTCHIRLIKTGAVSITIRRRTPAWPTGNIAAGNTAPTWRPRREVGEAGSFSACYVHGLEYTALCGTECSGQDGPMYYKMGILNTKSRYVKYEYVLTAQRRFPRNHTIGGS